MKKRTGILLINLGTPNSPQTKDVRKYLKEFLSDPRVIDIPVLARWILVNIFILPFRPKQSSKAYSAMWQEEGSPLLVYCEKLKNELIKTLDKDIPIALGMRYGDPSILQAILELKKAECNHVIVFPLFPQYSSSATGSALKKALTLFVNEINIPNLTVINEFYHQPFFIDSFSLIMQNALSHFKADHILFSYHGLPERHIDKAGSKKDHCTREQACPIISNKNHYCYRAQCFATSGLIAKKLNLKEEDYSTSFQSRLGRTPWIKPYTDEWLSELAKRGIKNIAVACPSFAVDCLETLEEIGMRAKEQWLHHGGKNLLLVPCLNANEFWVKSLGDYFNKLAAANG